MKPNRVSKRLAQVAPLFGAAAVAVVATSGLQVVAAPAPPGIVLSGSPSNFESGDGNMTVDWTTSGANDADWNCVSGFPGVRVSENGSSCSTTNTAPYFHDADPKAYTTKDISWVPGQKQDLDCPSLTQSKNPAKDTFTDVASYAEQSNAGQFYLYGGTIRYAANGNSSENVELKHGTGGTCSQVITLPDGTTTQLLKRVAGDELLGFDYLSGGTALNLHALTWIDSSNPTAGGNSGTCYVSSDTMPCWGAAVITPTAAQFNGQASQANIAAIDNGISGTCTGGPQGCSGTSVVAGAFAEFGVNLTAAGLLPANTCFSIPQVLWESRSSGSSFTSNPEDIEIENKSLNNCSSSTVTTPSAGQDGSVSIGTTASGSSADLRETDSATITVTGVSTFAGSVDFHLCGPLALTSSSNCQTGGTDLGSTTVSGSGGTATVTSPTATVTEVGLYCWRADYTDPSVAAGGQGIPGSSDPSNSTSQSECFRVTPVTPTLATSAAFASTSQIPAAVTDTLTLAGTANEPGTPVVGTPTSPSTLGGVAQGTITYTVYGPNSCTTVAQAATNVSVTSGDGNYTASFTANQPGTYTFVAQYSGDSPNTNPSAAVACLSQPSSESVTATDTSSASSTQTWLPNDTATVVSGSGLATLSGTLTLQLYDGTLDCGATGGQAVSGQLYSTTVAATSPQASITVASSNTTFSVTASDSVSWLVTFTPNNSSVSGSQHCESTSVTITN